MLPSSAEKREASQLYGAVVDETFPHGTLDAKFWSDPGISGLKVRGANYLQARFLALTRILYLTLTLTLALPVPHFEPRL